MNEYERRAVELAKQTQKEELQALRGEIERLKERESERELIECVKFYANRINWSGTRIRAVDYRLEYDGNDGVRDTWAEFGGKHAIETLKNLGESE